MTPLHKQQQAPHLYSSSFLTHSCPNQQTAQRAPARGRHVPHSPPEPPLPPLQGPRLSDPPEQPPPNSRLVQSDHVQHEDKTRTQILRLPFKNKILSRETTRTFIWSSLQTTRRKCGLWEPTVRIASDSLFLESSRSGSKERRFQSMNVQGRSWRFSRALMP